MSSLDLSERETIINLLLIVSVAGVVFGAPAVTEADGSSSTWGSGGFAMFADGEGDDNNLADSRDPAIWIEINSRLHDTIITTNENAKVEVRVSNDDRRQSHSVELALLAVEGGYRETVVLRDTIQVPADGTKEVTYKFSLGENAQQSTSFPHTIWVETAISSNEGRVDHSTQATAGQLTFRQPQWERPKTQLFAFSFLVMVLTAISSSTLRQGMNQLSRNIRENYELKTNSQSTFYGLVATIGQIIKHVVKLALKGGKEHEKRFGDDPGISIGALFVSFIVCLPILIMAELIVVITETLDVFLPSITGHNGTIMSYLAGLYFVAVLVGYFVILGTSRE